MDIKKYLATKYTRKIPIENHELIGHSYDFVHIMNENQKLFNKEDAKYKIEGNVMYLSDQYIEIKNTSGKIKILAQPFLFDGRLESEVNSTLIEELTNRKYNGNSKYNKRFLYAPFLKDKVKVFENMEEFNKFFKKGDKK